MSKPDGALTLPIMADLTEWSFDDAKSTIIKAMSDDSIPSDTPMSFILTTAIENTYAVDEVLKVKTPICIVNKDGDSFSAMILPSIHISHIIDGKITDYDEWCLTGYGCIKEDSIFRTFQYSVWSEGA